MHGETCMFRHEHRTMKQVHRRYYSPHLCVFEHLISTCTASDEKKLAFLTMYIPETVRLPIFKEIVNQSKVDEKADGQAFCDEDSKLEVWSIAKQKSCSHKLP